MYCYIMLRFVVSSRAVVQSVRSSPSILRRFSIICRTGTIESKFFASCVTAKELRPRACHIRAVSFGAPIAEMHCNFFRCKLVLSLFWSPCFFRSGLDGPTRPEAAASAALLACKRGGIYIHIIHKPPHFFIENFNWR